MMTRVHLLVIAGLFAAATGQGSAQGVSGLVGPGQHVTEPGAAIGVLAPVRAARALLEDAPYTAWTLGVRIDEIGRRAGHGSVATRRGAFLIDATIDYARVTGIDEVEDYERTGSGVPVGDVAIDFALTAGPLGSLTIGAGATMVESELAGRRDVAGAARVQFGWVDDDLAIALEHDVLLLVPAGDEARAQTRLALLGPRVGPLRPAAGVRTGGPHDDVTWGLGLRAGGQVSAGVGVEIGSDGIRQAGAELALRAGRLALGIQVFHQEPGFRGLGVWVTRSTR